MLTAQDKKSVNSSHVRYTPVNQKVFSLCEQKVSQHIISVVLIVFVCSITFFC